MDLNLTDHETELLRKLLQDYLPTLRWEVARTDDHDMRHELAERQDVVERLVKQLAAPAAVRSVR